MNPENVCLITPSRWFTGGMGLDKFRKDMLNSHQVKSIVDYTNAKDCFPNNSISGGVSYFLWQKKYNGNCKFTNITNGKYSTQIRDLSEFPILVRYNEAINIIHKVNLNMNESLSEITSGLMPFGLSTSYRGALNRSLEKNITLYSSSDKVTYISNSEIKNGGGVPR